MELSREVHTLLERIKKLSQHTQKNEKNETNSNTHYNLPMKISHLNINSSVNTIEDVQFSTDDLINVDSMDFSDNERWFVFPYLNVNIYLYLLCLKVVCI